MTYKLKVTIEVVDDEGNKVTHRGIPTIRQSESILADRTFTEQYIRPAAAHGAMNLVWGFLTPIENALARHKG